jgi:iron complex transport system ATP-binding protein
MSEAVLSARHVRVRRGQRVVVDDFTLSAAASGIYALTGPNGAGKSTALKALAGLVPCEGELSLSGRALGSLSARERARALAYVPQISLLQSSVSVQDVVLQGRYAHDTIWPRRAKHSAAVEQAMQRTDVLALAARPWNQLSGGEQRRVLLARALASEAPVVLLDEPTASLDVAHVLQLLQCLRQLADRGYCFVVALHDLEHVQRYADHATLLAEGRTVAMGPPAQVITAANVREIYGVELKPDTALGYELLGGAR